MLLKRLLSPLVINIKQIRTRKMANSKFEYVRDYEIEDRLLPNCWIIVRIDGRNFHKFSEKHQFTKPNDIRAINLMNRSALTVMQEFKDISIAYGQSDEYSFVIRKDATLFNRRGTKLMTYIVSLFTSSYVFFWSHYFKEVKLKYPPAFDSRIVLYPTDDNMKDYLSWRHVDCHINNLYNTTFWNLVLKGGLTNNEAEKRLCGTFSSDKNEILFSEFNINYNDEPDIFKKGTTMLRKRINNPKTGKCKQVVLPLHVDIISMKFWKDNSEIIEINPPGDYDYDTNVILPDLVLRQLRLNEDERERCDSTKESGQSN